MKLTAIQLDRAAGVLLGQACGDALGVPYEFADRPRAKAPLRMLGGGLGDYAPGEYSDDTQMAVCIAEVAATGADLRSNDALDSIAEGFLRWRSEGATDIGLQTRRVLDEADSQPGRTGRRLREAARRLHERTGMTAGNGALMRTGVVALCYLGDDEAIAEAARTVAELTHADPLAGDSCALWCIAIDRAVREARIDGLAEGLDQIPAERRDDWANRLDEAAAGPPGRFTPNGFTVTALQAAYSATLHTPIPDSDPPSRSFPCLHLQHALANAVRIGDDTDTVAAIAGALLGARWGVSAVPFGWRRIVHGWPSMRARDLVRLALLSAHGGYDDAVGWPTCCTIDYSEAPSPAIPAPHDNELLLGTANPTGVDGVTGVVSLCRRGCEQPIVPGIDPADHIDAWLIDNGTDNADLPFAVDDAARAVQTLRDEGKRVLLHCVRAEMRTPAVAARYAVLRGMPVDKALAETTAVLPNARRSGPLHDAVRTLGDVGTGPVEWRLVYDAMTEDDAPPWLAVCADANGATYVRADGSDGHVLNSGRPTWLARVHKLTPASPSEWLDVACIHLGRVRFGEKRTAPSRSIAKRDAQHELRRLTPPT